MTSKRFFYVLTGVLALLVILIIAGTIGGNIVLQKKSNELTALKLQNKSIEMQQTALVQAKKDVEKYSNLEKVTKSIVPQDKDQAKTVREIIKIADDRGVPIKSVTFQNSTLGDTTKTSTPTTTDSAAAATKTPAVASQLKPVDGIKGVYTLEIQVASDGNVSYQSFLDFLNDLEKNRRTAHVTAISLKPDPDNRQRLEFNLTLNAYVKP